MGCQYQEYIIIIMKNAIHWAHVGNESGKSYPFPPTFEANNNEQNLAITDGVVLTTYGVINQDQ